MKVLTLLIIITLLIICCSCYKVEIVEPNKEHSYLYIVGRDIDNNVICYGNRRNSAAISCIKVR